MSSSLETGGSPNGHLVEPTGTSVDLPLRNNDSKSSLPPPGQSLTGKQEHCACVPNILCKENPRETGGGEGLDR